MGQLTEALDAQILLNKDSFSQTVFWKFGKEGLRWMEIVFPEMTPQDLESLPIGITCALYSDILDFGPNVQKMREARSEITSTLEQFPDKDYHSMNLYLFHVMGNDNFSLAAKLGNGYALRMGDFIESVYGQAMRLSGSPADWSAIQPVIRGLFVAISQDYEDDRRKPSDTEDAIKIVARAFNENAKLISH